MNNIPITSDAVRCSCLLLCWMALGRRCLSTFYIITEKRIYNKLITRKHIYLKVGKMSGEKYSWNMNNTFFTKMALSSLLPENCLFYSLKQGAHIPGWRCEVKELYYPTKRPPHTLRQCRPNNPNLRWHRKRRTFPARTKGIQDESSFNICI